MPAAGEQDLQTQAQQEDETADRAEDQEPGGPAFQVRRRGSRVPAALAATFPSAFLVGMCPRRGLRGGGDIGIRSQGLQQAQALPEIGACLVDARESSAEIGACLVEVQEASPEVRVCVVDAGA